MKIKLITTVLLFASILAAVSCNTDTATKTLTREQLLDKIKGGWAAQTFGCTYGGPTEFRYNGCMIPDSVEIVWPDGYCKWYYENEGGLYDDIYMDLTFVEVFDKYDFDVPVDSLANAFAYAGYKLWHANQAARYNILNGISAPASGHWKNNPHADDIDFQIEADFAGLMAPGMVNSASEICDKVGHIMCYGDGWYGGVYVAALYASAFVYDDIHTVVTEALKVIPAGSNYYKCMQDVIAWCSENRDWKTTWQLVEDKWADEINCPQGTKAPFNIDAKLNSAYVVMGLLYGDGDMDRTLEVSTRCGADSDCNPATAGGILGTMLGYSRISEKWLKNIREVEDLNFDHTDISLNKVYRMSFDHALKMIERNGGTVDGDKVVIKIQKPEPVRLEQSFEGLSLVEKRSVNYKNFKKLYTYDFDGSAIVCRGKVNSKKNLCPKDYVAELAVTIDGNKEIVRMPADFASRKFDIYWNYDLPEGKHTMTILWLNPIAEANVVLQDVVVYTTK
ncbi:ADP-ribosylglycohydrolase family protein [Alistipes senegalensis]|uniref:ADP-ribosylglycohydrolase family protein n=1 Tax=Alistipes senegalensis JC50 TaxID=1033732 RepID=A0ABY5V4I1_9BACT|nr:ADP-ribosylglycohydrolase family protein [Alistipes senegalensis]UEA87885.1 ADP-ribosylglycohydrolase family protein [Alistipes senegalensis]UWN64525.1 ADP-ribosylglycohydrolase family protein [Alistipes senegalensis JC50]